MGHEREIILPPLSELQGKPIRVAAWLLANFELAPKFADTSTFSALSWIKEDVKKGNWGDLSHHSPIMKGLLSKEESVELHAVLSVAWAVADLSASPEDATLFKLAAQKFAESTHLSKMYINEARPASYINLALAHLGCSYFSGLSGDLSQALHQAVAARNILQQFPGHEDLWMIAEKIIETIHTVPKESFDN